MSTTNQYDFEKYDPFDNNSDDSDKPTSDHETVVRHGRWGSWLYCQQCGIEAIEREMNNIDCMEQP